MEDKVYIIHRDVCLIRLSECLLSESDSGVDDEISNLVRSIETFGVISPIVVEACGLGYRVLNGRRRCRACIALGLSEVPAIIMCSNIESDLIWLESKVTQSSLKDMKPSEIALIVYLYYEKVKSQGFRSDLRDGSQKHDGRRMTRSKFDLSERTISRYVRLYGLCEGLKQFVDRGTISLRAAVELSFLKNEEQWNVFDLISANHYGLISEEKAIALRRLSALGEYSELHAAYILENVKSNENFSIMKQFYKKYALHKYKADELRELLENALESFLAEKGNLRKYGTSHNKHRTKQE